MTLESKHEPKVIANPFQPAEIINEIPRNDTDNYLLIPEESIGPFPLIVRVTSGEDISDEVNMLTREGYGVFHYYADQKYGERDLRICALYQKDLEFKLEKVIIENPMIDTERIYVDGWLSAYLIFHTNRFRAAIQRPALINPTTAYGNCAAGWVERFGESLEEMMMKLADRSVLADVDHCKTPCLVLWCESELMYSREQSEQLYSAMKDRNPDVDCRMVVFSETQWEKYSLSEIIGWLKRFRGNCDGGDQ